MSKINGLKFVLGMYNVDVVRNCTDRAQLAKIVKTHRKAEMRKAAVANLSDQTVLADLLKTDKDCQVRTAAFGRLTDDQSVLADVAKNAIDPAARGAAAGKLTDQTALADLVTNSKDWDVRKAAVGRLTNQAILADVAKNDKDEDVRMAAVRRLTEQSILADMAKNDKNEDIRMAAEEKLTKLTGTGTQGDDDAWQRVMAKYGQYISGGRDLLDGKTYSQVRLHTFYSDRATANRVLGEVPNEITLKLETVSAGMQPLTGANKYHVWREGTLTGAQIKEYLITVVNGSGEIWEALI